jgi:Fe-Mn family superoxide dismutase
MYALGSVARQSRRAFVRTIFTVAELPNLEVSKGVPGLLSPAGLDVAWTQYQGFLVDKLNNLVESSADNLTLYELARNTDHNPDLAEINFYASQAYNNEFFFSSLKPSANRDADVSPPTAADAARVDISTELKHNPLPEDHQSEDDPLGKQAVSAANAISPESKQRAAFRAAVNDSFDSDVAFRELLLSRANATFGNGYVWLVQSVSQGGQYGRLGGGSTTTGGLFLVNTYNAGTPFAKQPLETQELRANSEAAQGMVAERDRPPALRPLLNINAWQHAYLTDYGVAGKSKYLENLFDCIDWNVLAKRLLPKHS